MKDGAWPHEHQRSTRLLPSSHRFPLEFVGGPFPWDSALSRDPGPEASSGRAAFLLFPLVLPCYPTHDSFFSVDQNKIMGRKPLKSLRSHLSWGLPQLMSDIHMGSGVSESHMAWAETWDFHAGIWDFSLPSQENLELVVWLWTREARKREEIFFFFDYHLSFIIGI